MGTRVKPEMIIVAIRGGWSCILSVLRAFGLALDSDLEMVRAIDTYRTSAMDRQRIRAHGQSQDGEEELCEAENQDP